MTLDVTQTEPDYVPPPLDTDAPPPEPAPVANGHRRNGTVNGHARGPRVPPHDLAAEASLIGAMLLSPNAIDAATSAGIVRAHFYKPAHGHIYDACTELHAQNAPVDPVTVADVLHGRGELEQCGGVGALVELMSDTPAISSAPRYAEIVLRHAHRRRAIAVAAEVADAAYNGVAIDPAAVAEKIGVPAPATTQHQWIELDAFIDTDEPDHDWLIPGLLERADRCIITATPGTGKSTLLRQLGVMAASGLHPFTATDIDPVRVLLLDVENSSRQIRREIRPLRDAAGTRYDPGMLEIRVFGESINLADPATLADIVRHVEAFQPGIICTGPLYKLIGGDPVLEKDARPVADAFDKIRHVCGSAVIIEAHSPYPVGKTTVIRPYGASLWERWPEFGWYFSAAGNIEHWRGQREERQWPAAIERSTPWPWAARHIEPTRVEGEEWHGPTQCIQAVVDFLRRHPDEDLTGNQLYTRLRADNQGRGFREQTVREAAEIAANDPDQPVTVRNGARNARLFSYVEGETEPELF